MIEHELYRFLTSTMSVSLTAQISSRVWIGQIAQDAIFPCVCMNLISRVDGYSYDIPSERIQFNCYANSYSTSKQVAETIVSLLKRRQGNIFSGSTITGSTYTVYKSLYENLVNFYDDSVKKYVSILDMIIQYKY